MVVASQPAATDMAAGSGPQQWVHWCAAGTGGTLTPKSVRLAVRQVLDDRQRAAEAAAQLRRNLLRTRPQAAAIDSYLNLMLSLVRGKSRGLRSESIEART